MENVYNTTDPQKLLELKKLESEALLDVLRTINHSELTISQLCLVARNVLRAQLGVKKMCFYYETDKGWEEGLRLGFEALSPKALREMRKANETSPITKQTFSELASIGAEYIIPIDSKDFFDAYFIIADFADTEVEAQNDIIFVETLGNILTVAIRNKQLFKEKMRRELLLQELEVAETIQRQLIISDFDRFREIDVYGINLPHHHVGGDFYDVIKKGKGTTFVCIADVSGKGIAAALLMSNLQANLRALCAQYSDLGVITTELNRLLYKITSGDKFVTMFIARIETQQQQLAYVNAGHNYPLFIRKEEYSTLDKGCLLLGIMPEIDVEEEVMPYINKDLLFMYTDGVPEQRDIHDHMFGQERLIDTLMEVSDQDSFTIVTQVRKALEEYSSKVGWNDDITMLSLKFI